jgi:hypothetical protein
MGSERTGPRRCRDLPLAEFTSRHPNRPSGADRCQTLPSPKRPLLAGVDAKRNLWQSLKTAAATRSQLDVAALDALIERARSQRERLQAAHDQAAAIAFGAS